MDVAKLAREANELLERLADRFPPDQLRICRTLAAGGEWGELVDNMCAVLVQDDVPVTIAERDALTALLNMYPIPLEDYDYISNRDQTLAALQVQE